MSERKSFSLFFLVAFLGCAPGPLEILAPFPDDRLTCMPQTLRVDYAVAGADEGSFVVELDGVDITDAFTVSVGMGARVERRAPDFWDPGLMAPGDHVLEAHLEIGGELHSVSVSFATAGDPHVDAVVSFNPGSGAGYGEPDFALGAPRGGNAFQGSLDVVSLGLSGTIELAFDDNAVFDGPGPDLLVFENAFLELDGLDILPPFSEPARIWVSQDGDVWHAFPCALDPLEAPYHPGCAGVTPVLADGDDPGIPHPSIPTEESVEVWGSGSLLAFVPPEGAGGDAFDLADLGLGWVRFVRIEAAPFTGTPTGPDNAAFDLDAVTAVHSVPFDDENEDGIPDALQAP